MSDFIRKITGIGATDNVNYIPVVYYCICDTNADTLAKTAKWVGKSDGNTVNGAIKLYKGLAVAVLFVNGFGESNSSSGNIYTLNIDGTGAKQMLLQGSSDNKLTFIEPNTAVVFLYDGSNYRVANGVTGAQLVELQEEIMGSLEDIKEGKVDLKELDGGGYAAATGNVDQPIYISDKHVEAIVDTFGSATNPIWLNEGHFTASTETVGSNTQPIYMENGIIKSTTRTVGSGINPVFLSSGKITRSSSSVGNTSIPLYLNGGTLTATSATIGTDVKPLKMVSGALTAVAANLATEQALNNEIDRATTAEQNLSDALDNEIERATQAESNLADGVAAAAHDIKLTSDNSDYKYTFQLKDANGNLIGSSVTINLPLETVVTGGNYSNGIISLILQNGTSITFPVVDIQNGLVKDPGANGAGSASLPVYVDNTGSIAEANLVLSRGTTNTAVGSSTNPVYIDATGKAVATGYNLSNFKTKQTAVTDPTASGDTTEFIASISQDVNGVITVTKKNVSLPGSFTPSAHTHSASDITSGTLLVARGGTGLSTNPVMLVNLGSTSSTTVFQASPSPGITGTLGIGNGGTGATTAAAARTNLGLGTAATHAHGDYAVAGHTHAIATSSTPGFMPKLSGNASQYLNGAGNWVSITDNNYYHTAGNYTLAASSGSSALKATIGGTGVNAITLSVPIYWGSATPTGTSTTGAIYIQIQ